MAAPACQCGAIMNATRRPPTHDPAERREAPSARRNAAAIAAVLGDLVAGGRATIIEIASGTGQHAATFTRAMANVRWHPSDVSREALASIAAWRAQSGCEARLAAPVPVDVTSSAWRTGAAIAGLPGRCDGVVCINMVHIAAWAACEGLLEGAGRRVVAGGFVYLYGPFKRDGRHTAASNAAFDRSLRARDAAWGVRDVAEVAGAAAEHGLELEQVVEMATNNLSVVLRRAG